MTDTTKQTSTYRQPAAGAADTTWIKPTFVVVPISESELNSTGSAFDGNTYS